MTLFEIAGIAGAVNLALMTLLWLLSLRRASPPTSL